MIALSATMTDNFQTRLDEEFKKFAQVRELLRDPLVEAMVRRILSIPNGNQAPKAEKQAITHVSSPKAHRRPGRRKSLKMVRVALEIVQKSQGSVSARHVAEQMEREGFKFAAKDKYIAVSKALRRMSEEGEIEATMGLTPKSPIMYSRKA